MTRPYEAEDAAGVAALVDGSSPPLYVWKLHRLHGPDRDEGGWKRTRVAVGADGAIAGAVTVARNRVHTGQYSLVVAVAPDRRRRGLGRTLVRQARRMRVEPLPLVVQLFESDVAGMALLRAEGGEVVQTTPGFEVEPAAMLPWCAAQRAPAGVVLDSLATASRDELVRAWVDLYVWQHEGWTEPPLSLPDLTRYIGTAVDATALDASAGAWVGGRLAAIAAAFVDPDGMTEIVTETARRDEPDGAALVAAVVADCLRRLADRRVAAVTFDGHLTDPHLHPVTGTFPPGLPTDPLLVARIR